MPQVPIQEGQTVNPQAVPDVRQVAPMRMMQMGTIGADHEIREGQQLEQAGNTLNSMAVAQQVHENEMNVKQMDANLMTGGEAILNGNPQDQNDVGYLGKVGGDATGAGKASALDAIQKLAQSESEKLTNPAQQKMAAILLQTRIAGLQQTVEKHATQQSIVANTAASSTRLGAAQQTAITSYSSVPTLDAPADNPLFDPSYNPVNPDGDRSPYQDALHTADAETNTLISLKYGDNIPADVRAQMVKQGRATVYEGVLTHLLDGGSKGGISELSSADLALARNYYEKVKGELPAASTDKYQQLMAVGATKTESLDTAMLLQQTFPGDLSGQMQHLDTLYQGGEMDPNVYHATMETLRSRDSADKTAASEQDRRFMGNVWAISQKPGTSMSSLSPSQIQYLTERNLGKAAEAMFSHNATTDDPKLFMDLMTEAQTNPAAFMQRGSGGIASLQGQLSDSNFNELVRTYNGINRSDVQQQTSDKLMHNTIQDVTRQLDIAGVNTHPKAGTDEEKQLAQFQTDLRQQLVIAQQQKKAPLTADEAKTIALGEVKEQSLAHTGIFGIPFFNTSKPVYQMSDDERAAAWVVPDTDRQQITTALQKAGKPATEENIQRTYKLAQSKKR